MLQIKTIDIFHIAIPVLKPFETSFGVVAQRPLLIFKIETTDGIIGFGESSPLYTPISEDEVLSDGLQLLQIALPQLLNVQFSHPRDIFKFLPTLNVIPVSRLGLEGAAYHALCKQQNTSIQKMFGGKIKKMEAGASIGIYPTIQEVFSEIELSLHQGLKRIKVKIKPGHDVNIIKAVREKYPSIPLGVDANTSYHIDQIDIFEQMDSCNLLFIEQPFGTDDFEAHTQLRRHVSSPVCLDETIRDLETTKKAISYGACDIVNIKPARIGSYSESIEIHDFCQANNIPMFGGGRMESGLGRFFNSALYSLPGFTLPSDSSPPLEYFECDTTNPSFQLNDGCYQFPKDNLIIEGEIREDILHKYLVEQVHIA